MLNICLDFKEWVPTKHKTTNRMNRMNGCPIYSPCNNFRSLFNTTQHSTTLYSFFLSPSHFFPSIFRLYYFKLLKNTLLQYSQSSTLNSQYFVVLYSLYNNYRIPYSRYNYNHNYNQQNSHRQQNTLRFFCMKRGKFWKNFSVVCSWSDLWCDYALRTCTIMIVLKNKGFLYVDCGYIKDQGRAFCVESWELSVEWWWKEERNYVKGRCKNTAREREKEKERIKFQGGEKVKSISNYSFIPLPFRSCFCRYVSKERWKKNDPVIYAYNRAQSIQPYTHLQTHRHTHTITLTITIKHPTRETKREKRTPLEKLGLNCLSSFHLNSAHFILSQFFLLCVWILDIYFSRQLPTSHFF